MSHPWEPERWSPPSWRSCCTPLASPTCPEPAAVGFDTPLYQYRANLIAEAGTDALEGWTPSYVHDQDRVTTATLWALLGSVTGREPSSLALLWPAAMGVAVGAAAAAFARSVWREPGWAAPIYIVAVGHRCRSPGPRAVASTT